jgi:hypothetical protein
MGSTFGLAFSIDHFIFLFVQVPKTSEGHLTDEQLMTISTRLYHFLMREYISHHSAYHTPDGRMVQFPALCDYIKQGRVDQLETHRKFKEICGSV